MRFLTVLFALLALAVTLLTTSSSRGSVEGAHLQPTVIGRIPLPNGGAVGLGINSETSRLYVGINYGGYPTSTAVFDLDSLQLLREIPAPGAPWGIGVDRPSNTIYVNDALTGTPYIIDGLTNTIRSKIEPNQWAGGLSVDEHRGKVYFASVHLAKLGVALRGEDTIAKEVFFEGIDNVIRDVAVDSTAGRVYAISLTLDAKAEVLVLDADSDERIGSIPLPGRGEAIEVDEKTGEVYVTCPERGSLVVLDGPNDSFVAELAVGEQPFGIAVAPDTKRAYVTNQGDGTVSVVDTASNAVIETLPVADQPLGVVADPERDRVYVAAFERGSGGGVVVIGEVGDTLPTTPTPTPKPSVGAFPGGGGPPPSGSPSQWFAFVGGSFMLLASYIVIRLVTRTSI